MNFVTIYGRPGCAYCEQAKIRCEREGIPHEYFDVSTDAVARAKLMEALPGVRMVPQIFSDGEHVGGYMEFIHVIESIKAYKREMTEQKNT